MNLAEEYIQQVNSGKVICSEAVRLSVQRHINYLKTAKKRGFYFDKEAGENAINFIKILRHTKGRFARKKFNMKPFQAFIIYMLFGWKESNGLRRFRKAYIEVARKNGKTELGAAILVYLLATVMEQGIELYTAATTKGQASIAFEQAKSITKMLRQDSATANNEIKIQKYSVFVPERESFLQAISAEHENLDGSNPYAALIDEYHAHKTSGVLDVIESGMGARDEPLLLIITTAGFNKAGPCYKYRGIVKNILQGVIEDDSVFGIIFEIDPEDYEKDKNAWQNEELCVKANPNVGDTPKWDYIRKQVRSAINEGGQKEVSVRTKNFNQWTDSSSTWIRDRIWMKNGGEIDKSMLAGLTCYGGLDLAITDDLASLCLFFPIQDGLDKHTFLWYNYIPSATMVNRTKEEREMYNSWEMEGLITITDGNVTDFSFIEAEILRARDNYFLHSIAYDPSNATKLALDLINHGIDMEKHGQTTSAMNEPCEQFKKMLMEESVNHGGNSLARWSLSNVEIKIDSYEKYKIDKSKAKAKVDPMVAAVMAVSQWIVNGQGSVYENQGVRSI